MFLPICEKNSRYVSSTTQWTTFGMGNSPELPSAFVDSSDGKPDGVTLRGGQSPSSIGRRSSSGSSAGYRDSVGVLAPNGQTLLPRSAAREVFAPRKTERLVGPSDPSSVNHRNVGISDELGRSRRQLAHSGGQRKTPSFRVSVGLILSASVGVFLIGVGMFVWGLLDVLGGDPARSSHPAPSSNEDAVLSPRVSESPKLDDERQVPLLQGGNRRLPDQPTMDLPTKFVGLVNGSAEAPKYKKPEPPAERDNTLPSETSSSEQSSDDGETKSIHAPVTGSSNEPSGKTPASRKPWVD